MIARHDGQVVLVSGAMPGERVIARIERTERRLAFASVVDVRDASPDRRAGVRRSFLRRLRLLAHRLSAAARAQGRHRAGRVSSPRPDAPRRSDRGRAVAGAWLSHARAVPRGRRPRRVLSRGHAHSVRRRGDGAGERRGARLGRSRRSKRSRVPARASLSVELSRERRRPPARAVGHGRRRESARGRALAQLPEVSGLTGCAVQDADGAQARCRRSDRGRSAGGPDARARGRRRAAASRRVVLPGQPIPRAGSRRGRRSTRAAGGAVLDLYAGVGLFSVALAASGRREVTAVEGDRVSGADLERTPRRRGSAVAPSPSRQRRALPRPSPSARRHGHRRSAAHRDVDRGDGVASRRTRRAADRLRVVRSGDDGARRAAAARWRVRARVAARVRSLPEHAARRVAGRVRARD